MFSKATHFSLSYANTTNDRVKKEGSSIERRLFCSSTNRRRENSLGFSPLKEKSSRRFCCKGLSSLFESRTEKGECSASLGDQFGESRRGRDEDGKKRQ